METATPPQLEGQTSINELLDEPIGTAPIQLALPIHFQPPSVSFRPERPRPAEDRLS